MRSAFVVGRRWVVTTGRLLGLVAVVFALLEARRVFGSDRPFGEAEFANEMRRLAQVLGISCAILGPLAALDVGLRLRSSGCVWVLAQSARGLESLVATAAACGAATCAAVWIGAQIGPQTAESFHVTKVSGEWVWRPWDDTGALALPRHSFELPRVDLLDAAVAFEDQSSRIGNAHWVAGVGVMASLCRGVESGNRSPWQAHAGFVNSVAATILLWAWMPNLALGLVVTIALAQALSIRIRGLRAP